MVGYAVSHTRDTYNLYNPVIKRDIMIRDITWAEWKSTDTAETMKMFLNLVEEDLVPDI